MEFKIGDKAQFRVKGLRTTWINLTLKAQEIKEIKTGVGFFDYRKPQ